MLMPSSSGGYFKQMTPIKDSPYYQLYNNIYSGAKKFNTGTWDGIIPKGCYVNVELVSTILDKNVGSNFDFALIYSGHGTADALDSKIVEAFTLNKCIPLLEKSKVLTNSSEISYTAYGTHPDLMSSIDMAKTVAYQKIYANIKKILRILVPQVLIPNQKSIKAKKYQEKLINLQTTNNLPKSILQNSTYNKGFTSY
jgi:hypothetical protein